MAFHIVRNYGGVVGLHVALNVFSEEAEEQLWAIFGVGGAAREEHDGGRTSMWTSTPARACFQPVRAWRLPGARGVPARGSCGRLRRKAQRLRRRSPREPRCAERARRSSAALDFGVHKRQLESRRRCGVGFRAHEL